MTQANEMLIEKTIWRKLQGFSLNSGIAQRKSHFTCPTNIEKIKLG